MHTITVEKFIDILEKLTEEASTNIEESKDLISKEKPESDVDEFPKENI